jgi:hypothetical protein
MLAWDVSTHPLGPKASVLFSSVFGPYAQNDEFGSRSINPMELYHNQVTRVQGEFSIRMFHRSWGLMMIQKNLANPSTLLDFPTREQFAAELKANRYDIVGISGIIVNIGKVREMCRIVRESSRRIRPSSSAVTSPPSRRRNHDRRRPHRQGRGHFLDAPLPEPGPGRSDQASRYRLRLRASHYGHAHSRTGSTRDPRPR